MHNNMEIVFSKGGFGTQLQCPFAECDQSDLCHVVDVQWETDPDEGDRKRVRLMVRCENGHGFVLVLKNHAGYSFFEWEVLSDNQSPFEENLSKAWTGAA